MPENIHNPENTIELHHNSIVEIMSRPPVRIIRIGSGVILTIFLLLIIGSAFFTYSDSISVPVVISNDKAYTFLVSPGTGKIINRINEGKFKVNLGDTISIIESRTKKNELFYIVSNLKGWAEMDPLWCFQSNVSLNDTLGIVYEDSSSRHFGIIHLPPQQVGDIKVGNRINISLDRFPSKDYGVIESKVRSISNFKNEKDFILLIDLPNNLKTSKGKTLSSFGNLTGTAKIIINEKSIFERIINPFRGM